MAQWTVTPSEGVIDEGDGKFIFPANDSYCLNEYTVTYTDNGCSCSVKVYVNGNECETTTSDPIWDDPECEGHYGSWVDVDGYYWIYPKRQIGCSECIEDEPYSAATATTEYCKEPGECYSYNGVDYYTKYGTTQNPAYDYRGTCLSYCCSGNCSITSVSSSAGWLTNFKEYPGSNGCGCWRAHCAEMDEKERSTTLTIYFSCGGSDTVTVTQYDTGGD